MKTIILASGSPRRKQLLELAQIPFKVQVSNFDESFPTGLSPANAALHIAEHKALTVFDKLTGPGEETILAADTIVVLNDEIIGKPVDKHEAMKTLSLLSGNVHSVITGVCILSGPVKTLFTEQTEVEFNLLTKDQIEYYINHFKPFDKAGAYAIQEWIGAIGIKSIKGDFYNVMGLPVSRVYKEFSKMNL